jgi:hypothetical protein
MICMVWHTKTRASNSTLEQNGNKIKKNKMKKVKNFNELKMLRRIIMKRNIINLIYCCFFVSLFACANHSTDDSGTGSKGIKVNSKLVTATVDNSHIYNRPDQTDKLIVSFKSEELDAILKINAHPKLTINAVVSSGDQLIAINSNDFGDLVVQNGSIAPIVTAVSTICKEKGHCDTDGSASIKFFVNNIEQDSKVDLQISDRSIRFEGDEQEHHPGGTGSLKVYASHIAPNDKFTVTFTAEGVEINQVAKNTQSTDNFCTFSGTNPDLPCVISYTVKQNVTPHYYAITAMIQDDKTSYKYNQIIVCADPELLFKVVGDSYIYINGQAHHMVNFSVQRVCAEKKADLVVDLGLSGEIVDKTEKTISDYIDVAKTVTIKAEQDTESFTAKLKDGVDPADATLHLGDSFAIAPTVDKKYGDFKIQPASVSISIKDSAKPYVQLLKDETQIDHFEVTAGSNETVAISSHKIDLGKLSFALLDNDKHDVSADIATATIEENNLIVEVKDGLKEDITYYVYAKYDSNPININDKEFIPVAAKFKPQPPTVKFEIVPNNKHILNAYPQDDFYIKVTKKDEPKPAKKLRAEDTNAYLYASDPMAGGCKGLIINKIMIDAVISNTGIKSYGIPKKTVCNLGNSSDILSTDCACTLAEVAAKTCIFEITTPSSYSAKDVTCPLQIKTAASLDLGSMSVVSTEGRKPITIVSSNSPRFPDTSYMEFWSKTLLLPSSTISSLNPNWGITEVDATSLMQDNSPVFDDIAIIKPLTANDFAVDYDNHNISIKRYPGRNIIGRAVTLSPIKFIMRYSDPTYGYDNNYWNDDNRCTVNENIGMGISAMSNLGCDEGGNSFASLHGDAFINPISIDDKEQITTNGVNITQRWKDNDGGKIKNTGLDVLDQVNYKLGLVLSE